MATFGPEKRETVIGGLIILGLVGLAGGLFMLDPIIGSFRNPDEFHAVLPEAPKLMVGTRVWIGGKDVGEVSNVIFMPFGDDSTARVALTLQFPHEYHEQLRRDSHVRITAARLIGAPFIDVVPGSAGAPPLEHGDTLYMDHLMSIGAVRAKAVAVKASFDTALVEVRALAGPMSTRMASLEPVMRSMGGAQREMTALMADFQAGPAAAFMNDGRLAAEIADLQRTASQLGPAFATARARMSDPLSGVGASIGRMQGNAERLSAALDSLQAMMVANNGTLYRMSADSAVMKTLTTARSQLDSLIAEAKKNPLPFVF